MKAMIIEEFGGSDKLKLKEVAKPKASENEVLIRVVDAGVNPVDWKIREGQLKSALPHEFPLILGMDVSGTVEEVGKNVKDLHIGDEVFAYIRKPTMQWGAYAEYVSFDAKDVVKKPRMLSFAEAAALPLISLTAWQSLFDLAHLKKGETVLIIGGGGCVGSMAIQFAKYIGAKVIATARKNKHTYVKKFGADLVVDREADIAAAVKAYAKEGVDVILDCVGGTTCKKSLSCLKRGGRFVGLIEQLSEAEAKRLGVTENFLFTAPNGTELRKIASLIESKHIVPPSLEEMPLKDAGKALEKLKAGNVLGKIVLRAKF